MLPSCEGLRLSVLTVLALIGGLLVGCLCVWKKVVGFCFMGSGIIFLVVSFVYDIADVSEHGWYPSNAHAVKCRC